MISRRTFVKCSLAGAALACGPRTRPATPVDRAAKQLLILGGTSFLGPELVSAAQARGHTVTLFNRGKTRPELFPELEKLRGDRNGDLAALAGRRWDAVIDTSGYVPRHVRLSAELLAPSVSHYVFISSISVYADTSVVGMDETAPVGKLADESVEEVTGGSYGPLKALCEQAAERAMPGRTTAIRPGLIVGPGDPTDRFTYWPVRVTRGGEVLAPGDGKDPVQIIDVRDLAEWTIALIERAEMGTFNATGPRDELTMAALLDACTQAASGAGVTFTWASAEFLANQGVTPWGDLPVWVPAGGEFAAFGTIDARRAQAKGLTFRAAEDTAAATLAWWATQPEERRGAPMHAGLTPEREAALLAAWKQT